MFIRKKTNKTGTTSIMLVRGDRVAGKKHPISRMIRNFGTTADKTELESLIAQAEAYRVYLLANAPQTSRTLRLTSDVDLKFCRSFNIGFNDVFGCFFDKIFHVLALKPHHLIEFKKLIIMRIASPASKRKTTRLACDFGFELNLENVYKLMDRLDDRIIAQIKQAIYQHTNHLLSKHKQNIDVLFYDLTTVYFETSSQDTLRDFGFSKDGKHQHVQIMLAVIVTKSGLPIDYEEFKGNTYELKSPKFSSSLASFPRKRESKLIVTKGYHTDRSIGGLCVQ